MHQSINPQRLMLGLVSASRPCAGRVRMHSGASDRCPPRLVRSDAVRGQPLRLPHRGQTSAKASASRMNASGADKRRDRLHLDTGGWIWRQLTWSWGGGSEGGRSVLVGRREKDASCRRTLLQSEGLAVMTVFTLSERMTRDHLQEPADFRRGVVSDNAAHVEEYVIFAYTPRRQLHRANPVWSGGRSLAGACGQGDSVTGTTCRRYNSHL
jgi:hypothetical protein